MKLGDVNFGTQTYAIELWDGKELNPLSGYIAVDTETELVESWTETPDVITLQAFDGNKAVYVEPNRVPLFISKHMDMQLVFHNFAFDNDVICKVAKNANYMFDLIDADRIYDTSILYRLWHLAQHGWVPFQYNLALLSKDILNEELPKDDELRLNWGEYKNKPISEIPKDMLEYGAKDVIATYFLFRNLKAKSYNVLPSSELKHSKSVLSHSIQLKGDVALQRLYKRGIGFNVNKAKELLSNLKSQMEKYQTQLAHWGWIRGRKGSQDAFDHAVEVLGIKDKLPVTDTGIISSKEEDLIPYSNLEFINNYIQFHKIEKLTSFIDKLDTEVVHPRYSLLMNTGRTSCKDPNFQQLPREGGIRQLFVAQPNHTFIITDYSTIELCTLAQVCYNRLGYSVMGDKINEGIDLHKYYASVLYSVGISEVTKEQRQSAKAANFGFPGGLGISTFIRFASTYGLDLTEEEACRMKDAWFEAFPEMEEYLKDKKGYVITETGRLRGDTSFCAEKNTPFQGLAADGAKLALYRLEKEGFSVRGFVHDEIVVEVTKKNVDMLKTMVECFMVNEMQKVVPDVKISVESTISEVYCK